jgi:dTMP kinase
MKLFVIEGIDGSGKSTQMNLLNEYLLKRGFNCEFLHFPRTNAPFFGELIAKFLRGEFGSISEVDPYLVALLYAGDRKDASDKIRGWLDENKVVLLDRYTYSNIAYQCAKTDNSEAQNKLMNWILDLEFKHFGIPKPDLNFFLDVPFSFTKNKLEAIRSGNDRSYLNGTQDIHEESLNFQKQVREVYLKIARSDDRLIIVTCYDRNGIMESPEMISSKIIDILNDRKLI